MSDAKRISTPVGAGSVQHDRPEPRRIRRQGRPHRDVDVARQESGGQLPRRDGQRSAGTDQLHNVPHPVRREAERDRPGGRHHERIRLL